MKRILRDQSGAALLTILLFVVIMLILVTTMLTVAGNESVISGLHRDSVRAKEIAEGGLSEALLRIARGHYYALNTAAQCYDSDPDPNPPFNNSLVPDGSATVRVCLQEAAAGAAVLEIQSNATVGVARRRLSVIAQQQVTQLLPNIVFGHDCSSGGSAEIASGDVYCQTYVKHKTDTSAAKLTYGGWFIKKQPQSGPAVGPCYTHADCVSLGFAKWWPGHRRAMYKGTPINEQLEQGADDRKLSEVFTFACSPSAQDTPLLTGPTVSDLPAGAEWQTGDRRQDNSPMPSDERLYGCTKDGRPYTWVREAFDSDDPDTAADVFMWFKTIEFEDWFKDYWRFCNFKDEFPECDQDAEVKTFVKVGSLATDESLGAVPPFPDFEALDNNPNQTVTGGGTLTGADPIDWGTCVESDTIANNCDASEPPQTILLTAGDYKINANIQAHATVLVGPNANLEINGTFTCWCVLVVDGNLTLGNGTVTIYGGLIAKNTAELNGNITVYAGGSVASVPVGSGQVDTISWWQR